MEKITIANVKDYAKNHAYITVNSAADAGARWFYGAWDNLKDAAQQADEIGGMVFRTDDPNVNLVFEEDMRAKVYNAPAQEAAEGKWLVAERVGTMPENFWWEHNFFNCVGTYDTIDEAKKNANDNAVLFANAVIRMEGQPPKEKKNDSRAEVTLD